MRINYRKLSWVGVLLAALGGFAWYQAMPAVPQGQPPLVTLDTASVEAFRADFNRHTDRVRVIALLAPT